MRFVIKRDLIESFYTAGRLYLDGSYVADTLELPIPENPNNRVRNKEAIPEGTYKVFFDDNRTNLSRKIKIEDTNQFSGVYIEIGNTVNDTTGCILVGKRDKDNTLKDSTETLRKIISKIKDKNMTNATLQVINLGQQENNTGYDLKISLSDNSFIITYYEGVIPKQHKIDSYNYDADKVVSALNQIIGENQEINLLTISYENLLLRAVAYSIQLKLSGRYNDIKFIEPETQKENLWSLEITLKNDGYLVYAYLEDKEYEIPIDRSSYSQLTVLDTINNMFSDRTAFDTVKIGYYNLKSRAEKLKSELDIRANQVTLHKLDDDNIIDNSTETDIQGLNYVFIIDNQGYIYFNNNRFLSYQDAYNSFQKNKLIHIGKSYNAIILTPKEKESIALSLQNLLISSGVNTHIYSYGIEKTTDYRKFLRTVVLILGKDDYRFLVDRDKLPIGRVTAKDIIDYFSSVYDRVYYDIFYPVGLEDTKDKVKKAINSYKRDTDKIKSVVSYKLPVEKETEEIIKREKVEIIKNTLSVNIRITPFGEIQTQGKTYDSLDSFLSDMKTDIKKAKDKLSFIWFIIYFHTSQVSLLEQLVNQLEELEKDIPVEIEYFPFLSDITPIQIDENGIIYISSQGNKYESISDIDTYIETLEKNNLKLNRIFLITHISKKDKIKPLLEKLKGYYNELYKVLEYGIESTPQPQPPTVLSKEEDNGWLIGLIITGVSIAILIFLKKNKDEKDNGKAKTKRSNWSKTYNKKAFTRSGQ